MFVKILGYTLNPEPNFNLTTELKNMVNNEQKEKAQTIKSEIEKTDKEIDRMVFELYGLTKEEIKIVENS